MSDEISNPEEYNASSIKVLKGLEAVKKRPGMYIGDTGDGSGLHHMVFEVLDNAIDESLAGHCDDIFVIIEADGSVTVTDNGRGIPVDIHKEEGISAAEVIMTQLHSGGKFDQNSYKISGGLHGVGVSVVNALSSCLKLTIHKNGKKHFCEFKDGATSQPLRIIGDTDKKGTEVNFLPAIDTFGDITFHSEILEKRIREIAFLNSGIKITFQDKRAGQEFEKVFFYEGGLSQFIEYINEGKQKLTPVIFCKQVEGSMTSEVVLQWNDSYHDNGICFTNNIKQKDGGTHLSGFRNSLTRVINDYIERNNHKKKIADLTGDDIREGLTYIISVKMPDPKFSSQTKDKLVSSEIRSLVESSVSRGLGDFLEQNPAEALLILNKINEAALAREAARKARELSRKKGLADFNFSPGKLADCQTADAESSELFIVEGNSAGGTAKQGRNRKNQAVLALRGKILNVEKARIDKMLNSDTITSIISTLGTGIGKDEFNVDKIKYHKIFIMTDADVDGSHIRTLLLTFFYRQMKEVIERGYLYLANPPLYKIKKGNSDVYAQNDQELDKVLIKNFSSKAFIKDKNEIQISGLELENLIYDTKKFINNISNLKIDCKPYIIFNIIKIINKENYNLENLDTDLIKDLNQNIEHEEEKWSSEIKEASFLIKKILKNISYFNEIKYSDVDFLINSILKSNSIIKVINSLSDKGFIDFDGEILEYSDPFEFMEMINKYSSKGYYIQRFKGLGEMNAEQLWDTTLDPETRTITKITLDDAEIADKVFTSLMGDDVEPRRKFIIENALKAENIDV